MAGRTAFTPGNGQGSTFGTLINATDLNSMANGSSVLSGVAAIDNATNLDMFMDVSIELAIASSTIAAGAYIALWLFYLNEDGTIYGDNSLVASTQAAVTPGPAPDAVMPLRAASSQTSLIVSPSGLIQLKPRKFIAALQNGCGFALASSGNIVKFTTWNLNLNN